MNRDCLFQRLQADFSLRNMTQTIRSAAMWFKAPAAIHEFLTLRAGWDKK